MKTPKMAGAARIILPDGSERTRELDAARAELLFGDTYQQGVYQVEVGTNRLSFAVNLLDPAETDITPQEVIQMGEYASVSSNPTRQANLELWRWFALTALLILMFEWWYYHKRTA